MNMMEKYSTNLEEIVEERTGQIEEEKKKTDQLVYSMLPAYVVRQTELVCGTGAAAVPSYNCYLIPNMIKFYCFILTKIQN